MWRNTSIRGMCVVGVLALVQSASSGTVLLSGVPDFSQHARVPWQNYCGPTNGANVVYYFQQAHANLGGPLPPDPGAALFANDLIELDLAVRMGTTTGGGTTALGLRDGLDSYLEDTWDLTVGGTDWNTTYVSAASLGGADFWTMLQNEIGNGSGIILLIAWQSGNPGAGYDLPDGYDGGTSDTSAIGHAVTMTGYNTNTVPDQVAINDPANNAGAHAWSGENSFFNVTTNANDLSISLGGSTATIYGAVITTPAPGALALLGLAAVIAPRRRRR